MTMRVYQVPSNTPDAVTLMADRATWEALVPLLAASRAAPAIQAMLKTADAGVAVRVSLSEEDARKVLTLAASG